MNYAREMLIGRWYRSDIDEDNVHFTEYAQLSVDGSFEFSFINHDESGQVSQQIIELGDWGLVGDIHFTITKGEVVDEHEYGADLADENNYHAYRVLQLDNQIFKYQHIVSNEVFILRRVIDKIGFC
ncbi:hypothetical protein [Thalassotalea sp. PLHSN55]|uniref:hypothetical protein n=1 Tax=Thalassotalea sp. PLHSN55 TaxID=3435888 RepID=UPI003F8603C6